MTIARGAALATLLSLAAAPALAASCHMTVQGVPVIDGACTAAGRRGDVLFTDAAGDALRIRGSVMSGRFLARRARDGRLHDIAVSYGQVLRSADDGPPVCYFNQKATLCVEP